MESTQRRIRRSSTESRCRLVFWPAVSPLQRPAALNVERPLLGAVNDRTGSVFPVEGLLSERGAKGMLSFARIVALAEKAK